MCPAYERRAAPRPPALMRSADRVLTELTRSRTVVPRAEAIQRIKLNGVDPQRYLTDLLTRLVQGWPHSRIDELMPWRCTKTGQA